MNAEQVAQIDIAEYGRLAKRAASDLALADSNAKNAALASIADALEQETDAILQCNALDLEACRRAKRPSYYIDRMQLNKERIEDIAVAARAIAAAEDPVGETLSQHIRKDGLNISRIRAPLGVVGVIYESRPNVTVDITALCVKSGNAVILRGGSDALNTNAKLTELVSAAIENAGLPADSVQLIKSADRDIVKQMLTMDKYIDVIIPRGSSELIDLVNRDAAMPVIAGGAGVCHTYVDDAADLDMAYSVILNAKTQRHTVCNALDTVLVHQRIAHDFLPGLAARFAAAGVEMRVDKRAMAILGPKKKGVNIRLASAADFRTEHLALIANIKVVDSLAGALEHIAAIDSRHTEAIITGDQSAAERFIRAVDAAAVMWNASSYFCDGGEFGLGAEVAVSTGKMHARGPVGLRELTTYKWAARGNGHIRT